MTEEDREELPLWPGFEYRLFNFSAYPAHFDMAVLAGQYAWKPIMIGELADEILELDPYTSRQARGVSHDGLDAYATLMHDFCKDATHDAQKMLVTGPDGQSVVKSGAGGNLHKRRQQAIHGMTLIWADAASIYHTLFPLGNHIATVPGGIFVRTSAGTLAQYTHPSTFEYFGVSDVTPMANMENTEAGFIGFQLASSSPLRSKIWCEILEPWRRCAYERQCIGPIGSNKKNHRQDQVRLGAG